MKKRGMLYLLIFAFTGVALNIYGQSSVSAAACSNVSSFGAVTLNAPELSNIQNQSLWVRLQGQTGSKVLVEVNENDCHEITLQNDQTSTWSWQTIANEGQPQPISFSKSTGNTVKLIGISEGVRLDRVLITEPECTPQDYGNNCKSSISLSTGEDKDSIAVPSPSGPVSGFVHLSPTLQNGQGNVSSVVYSVNGRVLQQEITAKPFDSTLLENGRYTVHISTTLQDGQTVREIVVVDIKNPENALTPLIRWIKQHQTSLRIIGFGLLAIATSFIVLKFIVGTRRTRRERTFRGL